MSTTICRLDSPVTRMESMETQSAQLGSTTHDQTILSNYNEEDFEDDSDYWDLEYDSEGKHAYDSGWFYPLCIGDKITIKIGDAVQDRYQISHRLGRGGFSTVWLAQDLCLERAVALKVLAPGDAGNKEYNIQETVAHSVDDPSQLILCNMEETFLLQGANGTHRVLVLPVAGPNLMGLETARRPIFQRMSAAKQVLEAIASLHEAGLVHGDISLGNILWGVKADFKEMLGNLSATHNNLGFPKRIRYETECHDEHAPQKHLELVKPLEFPTTWLSDEVFLTDFGLVSRVGDSVEHELQGVMRYLSPERFHHQGPSPASDMWSFGVVFVYLYTGFLVFGGGSFISDTNEDCLKSIVERLGPLPASWKGHHFAETQPDESWYDPDVEDLPVPRSTFETIMLYDRERHNIDESEKPLKEKTEVYALAIIKKIFAYLPEQRPTASQLLEDPDFRKLMELCGVQDDTSGQ